MVDEMGQHELALGAVDDRLRRAGLRIDQFKMHEASSAEMHAGLFLALAPKGNRNVSDAHRLGDARAPGRLELGAHGGFSPAGLARDHHPLHARLGEVHAALPRPFGEMQGVGRRRHDGAGLELVDRGHQPLGVSRADRNMAKAEPVEGVERGAGDERPGVVARDDAFAAHDAGGRVGARGGAHPDLEIGGGEGNVARRPGRAAGRIDARDLAGRRGQMRADRLFARARGAQLVLFGERQRGDRLEPADRFGGSESGARQLVAIEARTVEEIDDPRAIERLVVDPLRNPRIALDARLEHRHQAAPLASAPAWSIASSPLAAR